MTIIRADLAQPWGVKLGSDLHQPWTGAAQPSFSLAQPWSSALAGKPVFVCNRHCGFSTIAGGQ